MWKDHGQTRNIFVQLRGTETETTLQLDLRSYYNMQLSSVSRNTSLISSSSTTVPTYLRN